MKSLTKLFALSCTILLPCLSFAHFELCEFEGDYIACISSAGATTNSSADFPANSAISAVAQFKLKKDGKGTVHFLSVTNFFNSNNLQVLELTNLPITYSLTHHKIGVGTLTVHNYPIPGSDLVTDFVARKGFDFSSGGCVKEILFNVTALKGPVPRGAATVIQAHRQ